MSAGFMVYKGWHSTSIWNLMLLVGECGDGIVLRSAAMIETQAPQRLSPRQLCGPFADDGAHDCEKD